MPVSRVSFCVRGKTIEKLHRSHRCTFSDVYCQFPGPALIIFVAPRLLPNFYRVHSKFVKTLPRTRVFFRALAEFYFAAICNPKSNIINVKWPTSQSSAGVNLFLFCFVYFCGVSLCCCVKWSTTCMSRQNWTVNTPVRKPARKLSADSGIYTDKRPKTTVILDLTE